MFGTLLISLLATFSGQNLLVGARHHHGVRITFLMVNVLSHVDHLPDLFFSGSYCLQKGSFVLIECYKWAYCVAVATCRAIFRCRGFEVLELAHTL